MKCFACKKDSTLIPVSRGWDGDWHVNRGKELKNDMLVCAECLERVIPEFNKAFKALEIVTRRINEEP